MSRNRRRFRAAEKQDFVIENNSGVLGHLRIKPSAIMWKPKGKHMYFRVPIEDFEKFAVENGKETER